MLLRTRIQVGGTAIPGGDFNGWGKTSPNSLSLASMRMWILLQSYHPLKSAGGSCPWKSWDERFPESIDLAPWQDADHDRGGNDCRDHPDRAGHCRVIVDDAGDE